ncbi:fimbrial protein [Burkholderia diffusa]|uniref:fimbrial protein n=1 Tax=Burkholderia diffusa TaxID=488732 RepID=UPI0009BFDE72|nr:fimbrial protein [Burkholderia diffusa]
MNRTVLLLTLAIWSAYSAPAFSVSPPTTCHINGSDGSKNVATGDSATSVPAANMPLGAVVWRSSEITVEVTCERLKFYSEKSDRVKIRQAFEYGLVRGLRPGYTFQGIDYIMDGTAYHWVETPYMLGPNVGDKVKFNLTFSVNIQRYGGNDVPKSGPVYNDWRFPSIQVAIPHIDLTEPYTYGVYVLNPGITLMECGADVRISKNMIDFNDVSAFRAVNNAVVKQVPFEISSSRSCPGKFKVNATLKPLVSNSYTRGDFIMPLENDSIGIRIRNQGSGEIFPFNQKKELADLTSATSQTNRYVAEAVWQTDKPKLGRFEAGATLQIEYQ